MAGAVLSALVLPTVLAAAGPASPAVRAGEPLTVVGYDYRPRVATPPTTGGILEVPANAGCFLGRQQGGTVELSISNPASSPVRVDQVLLNGLAIDSYEPSTGNADIDMCTSVQPVAWWTLDSPSIPAGGVATLTVNGDLFRAGTSPTFGFVTDAGQASAAVELSAAASRVTAMYFDVARDRTRVYLAPGEGHIDAVQVNGEDVAWAGPAALNPAAPTLLTLKEPLTPGDPFVLAVGVSGSRPVLASRRVVRDRFINSMGVLRLTQAHMKRLRDTGFNSFTSFDPRDADKITDFAAANDMGVILFGRGDGAPRMELFREYADRPAVWAFETIDEPDVAVVGDHSTGPATVMDQVEQTNVVDPARPASINLAMWWAINVYGPIGDVNGWDHYPYSVDPLDVRLEGAAMYGDAFRANRGPHPFWFWPAAYFDVNRINGGYNTNLTPRWPQPDDTRAYNWMALGHGAKGIRWFIFQGEQTLTSRTWPEVRFETRLLRNIGQDLAAGTVWSEAARTSTPLVDVSTVVAPGAAYLTAANLMYDNHLDPTVWIDRPGVRVDWTLPPWLADRNLAIAKISGNTIERLGNARGSSVTVTTDLHSADLFVAMPKARLAKLIRAMTLARRAEPPPNSWDYPRRPWQPNRLDNTDAG